MPRPLIFTIAVALSACGALASEAGAPPAAAAEEGNPISQLQQDAEKGNVRAQYALGCCYNGDFGNARDPVKAAAWWAKAAGGGSVDAQFCIGLCCYLGEGVPRDTQRAVGWWTQAAGQDHAEAEYFLGLSYLKGLGIGKDPAKAVHWLEKSAKEGNTAASLQLKKIGLVVRSN